MIVLKFCSSKSRTLLGIAVVVVLAAAAVGAQETAYTLAVQTRDCINGIGFSRGSTNQLQLEAVKCAALADQVVALLASSN